MRKVFFSSDHHFGHSNIIRYGDRPFRDVDEMNRVLAQRWNSVVDPDAEVYHLGDVSLGMKHLDHVAGLNGRKILVAGNHDRCWDGNPRREQAERSAQSYLNAGFDEVVTSGIVRGLSVPRVGEVVLSHLPYEANPRYEGTRFDRWRPKDEGLPLIHGHVHQEWKVRGSQFNVSVEVWDYFPVPMEALAELILRERG